MVNKKITDLTNLPTPVAADVIAIVDDVGGAGVETKKATLSNALAAYDNQTSTLENKSIDQDGTGNNITNIANASIKASAGIAQSKLSLDITNAEVNASAAIAYSKLNLTGAVVDGDLAGSITPTKVTGTAAILGANTFTGSQTLPGTILKSQGTPGLGGLTFEPTGTNTIGHLVINPSGTNNRAQLSITRQSDPTVNLDALTFGSDIVATNEFGFRTFSSGTGTIRPFSFYVDTTKVLNFPANASGVEVNVGMDMLGNNIDNVQNIIHDQTDYTSVTGATTVNFGHDQLQTYALTGNITISTSGSAAGKSKTMKITPDGTDRTVTVPATWKWVGTNPTTSNVITITASKTAILTLTAFGGGDANIVAAYAVEE